MNLTATKNLAVASLDLNTRRGPDRKLKSIQLFGAPVSSLSMSDVLEVIDKVIDERRYIRITAINASKLYQARRNERLRKILQSSDINIPEYAVMWGARKLGLFLPEHVGGLMLMRRLLEVGSQRGYKFYFLGAKKEIVTLMVQRLQEEYPGIEMVGYHDGYFDAAIEKNIIRELKLKRPDILLIAMGTPRQEYWIDEHFEQLKIPISIGVGGSFDVFAGLRQETPAALRRGFEWIYRLAQDPLNTNYWKRYLTTNPWFAFQIYRSKLMVATSNSHRKKASRPVLVVGTPQNVTRFLSSAKSLSKRKLDIVGILPTNGECHHIPDKHTVFSSDTQLSEILHQRHVQEVVFTPDLNCLRSLHEMLKTCELEGVPSKVLLYPLAESFRDRHAEVIDGVPVVSCIPAPRRAWKLFLKRMIDVTGSFLGLILLAPLFLIIAVSIKLTSKGPIFYRWKVLGLHKRPIVSYKLRTMVQYADELKRQLLPQNEMRGPVFKMEGDPRITPLGRILRKYSIDELPQLWSVLKGDMSLVGPRPAGLTEWPGYKPWQRRRLSVTPGMTCLWQVNGRNKINDFDEWVKLDLYYIDNWSLWLDFKILFKTIGAVLAGTGE